MMCRVFDKLDILEARLNKQNQINARLNNYINKVNRHACFMGLIAVGYVGYTYVQTCKAIKRQAMKIDELQNIIDESEEMKG